MPDFLNPFAAFAGLQEFLETGGGVLSVIMFATFVLWAFIIERLIYWYGGPHAALVHDIRNRWAGAKSQLVSFAGDGSRHQDWVRNQLVSEVRQRAQQNVELIKTLVAIAPLLGLLGTVTGMVSVFDVMAISGSSNARAMSAGVSRATIPTMAGMVAALSGLFFTYRLEQMAKGEVRKLEDELE